MKNHFAPFDKHDAYSGDFIADEALKQEEKEEKTMEQKKVMAPKEQAQEVAIFKADKALERVDEVIKFIEGLRARLVEGEDYDKHPGYQKPSLEKPGAEKICVALNCGPEIIKTETRVINQQLCLKEYELVLGLRHRVSGMVVGEGVGYGRADEKDLYAFDKEANKRILKPERAEWANNTALKMAYKSALICATLSTASLSGYFTQDMGKIANGTPAKPKPKDTKPQEPQGTIGETMPFGVHQGKTFEAIYEKKPDYFEWLLKQDWFNEEKWSELKGKVQTFLDEKRFPDTPPEEIEDELVDY